MYVFFIFDKMLYNNYCQGQCAIISYAVYSLFSGKLWYYRYKYCTSMALTESSHSISFFKHGLKMPIDMLGGKGRQREKCRRPNVSYQFDCKIHIVHDDKGVIIVLNPML